MKNAQRRQKSWKTKRRYFLVASLLLLIAGICVSGWALRKLANGFPIRQIVVQGQLSHVAQSDVVQIVQEQLHGDFFSLTLTPVSSLLLSNPWIKQVAFRRVWPDTLVVSVTQKQALARWGDKGVMTTAGDVFYPDPKTIPKDLPDLFADDAKASLVLQQFQTLNDLLKPLSLSVWQLFLSDQDDWRVVLNNGIDIQMGARDVLPHFERLVRVYQKLLSIAPRPIAKIDLRYPNGFSVTYLPPNK